MVMYLKSNIYTNVKFGALTIKGKSITMLSDELYNKHKERLQVYMNGNKQFELVDADFIAKNAVTTVEGREIGYDMIAKAQADRQQINQHEIEKEVSVQINKEIEMNRMKNNMRENMHVETSAYETTKGRK